MEVLGQFLFGAVIVFTAIFALYMTYQTGYMRGQTVEIIKCTEILDSLGDEILEGQPAEEDSSFMTFPREI